MYQTCPKCGHERSATETAPETECPACGVIFAKWMRQRFSASNDVGVADSDPGDGTHSLPARIAATLLHVPAKTDSIVFYFRVAVLLGLFIWGWQFILMDYYQMVDGHRMDSPVPEIGASFMHAINTPFHEAGHVVFGMFGRFIGILGGTLGQLLMPIIVMLVFLYREHNTFAASVGLWWLAQSLMDCAPYINDARNMQIPLIGGGSGSEGRGGLHDWHNILMDLNLLHNDHAIADAVDALGVLVMLLAFAWGAVILHKQYKNL